jgi:hypothetical protein
VTVPFTMTLPDTANEPVMVGWYICITYKY